MRGSYSVAPGGDTGWRRLPGTTVLAVTKGKLMLHGGAGCAAREYATGQAGVIPAGVSVATSAAGLFVSSHYSHDATLEIKAGTDMFATRYDASPGWSSGWFAHYPAVNVMEGGEPTYVEAKEIAANEGKDHVYITTIYFGLPHGESLPGPAGNQLVAADFSQAPPADCPRLR